MDKIWDRTSEKTEWPRRTDNSRTLKKGKKETIVYMWLDC